MIAWLVSCYRRFKSKININIYLDVQRLVSQSHNMYNILLMPVDL